MGIDIPVTINMIWIGPNSMVPIMTNQTLLSRGVKNASTMITLHSFGRSDSGNYSCAAFLTSSSLLLNTSQSLSSTIVSRIRSLVAIIPQTDMESGTFQMAGRYHAIGK